MTIRTGGVNISLTNTHFAHATYDGGVDSGYYPIPYSVGTNGMIRNALGVPGSARLYVRKLSLRLIWAGYNKGFSEWVGAVEIPFPNHFESKESLGGCYMPLTPCLNFEYVTVLSKNIVSKQRVTVQPSLLFYLANHILYDHFGVEKIFYHTVDASGGYSRKELDLTGIRQKYEDNM